MSSVQMTCVKQQSPSNFTTVASGKPVFLPISCLEILVEQMAFAVYLSAHQRQPLEALSG